MILLKLNNNVELNRLLENQQRLCKQEYSYRLVNNVDINLINLMNLLQNDLTDLDQVRSLLEKLENIKKILIY